MVNNTKERVIIVRPSHEIATKMIRDLSSDLNSIADRLSQILRGGQISVANLLELKTLRKEASKLREVQRYWTSI